MVGGREHELQTRGGYARAPGLSLSPPAADVHAPLVAELGTGKGAPRAAYQCVASPHPAYRTASPPPPAAADPRTGSPPAADPRASPHTVDSHIDHCCAILAPHARVAKKRSARGARTGDRLERSGVAAASVISAWFYGNYCESNYGEEKLVII